MRSALILGAVGVRVGLLDTQLVSRNREVALDLPSSGSHTKDKGRVREGGLSTGKGQSILTSAAPEPSPSHKGPR